MAGVPAAQITSFFENLRVALGDVGSNGVYQYKDEQLAGAIRTTIETGLGPKGVTISEDRLNLDPAPATFDARGFMIFQAALLLIGGRQNVNFATRAMKVTHNPAERAASIEHYRRKIKELEESGDPHGTGGRKFFGVWTDFENHVFRHTCPTQVA